MPYEREAEIVLAMSREAERNCADVDPGSHDASRYADEAFRFRTEYERLIADAARHDGRMPPPWPSEDQPEAAS